MCTNATSHRVARKRTAAQKQSSPSPAKARASRKKVVRRAIQSTAGQSFSTPPSSVLRAPATWTTEGPANLFLLCGEYAVTEIGRKTFYFGRAPPSPGRPRVLFWPEDDIVEGPVFSPRAGTGPRRLNAFGYEDSCTEERAVPPGVFGRRARARDAFADRAKAWRAAHPELAGQAVPAITARADPAHATQVEPSPAAQVDPAPDVEVVVVWPDNTPLIIVTAPDEAPPTILTGPELPEAELANESLVALLGREAAEAGLQRAVMRDRNARHVKPLPRRARVDAMDVDARVEEGPRLRKLLPRACKSRPVKPLPRRAAKNGNGA
ncbi:hypothetical protein BV25DRAFT_1828679 [Artomyces pyxidatus]|uniref:Uncharacterized protein n=1 Tax=Artomyces pyxidatus TaxID=48021 RepID=A0ACB8SV54_9AGAM|nr:hypothetical protein BV25DRAFT_1828679 [Artomyces pyxidatus]